MRRMEARRRKASAFLVIEAFPVLGQSSAAAEQGECAFDDPAFGQGDEARARADF